MSKQAKMIACKHCGQEIAESAKVCPHCGGKNKKPFYKKPLFWILAVVVVLVCLAAGNGGSEDKTESKKVGEVNAQEADAGKEQKAEDAVNAENGENAENAEKSGGKEKSDAVLNAEGAQKTGNEENADDAGGAEASEQGKSKEEETTQAPMQEIYRVGDILHDGNMDIVYVSSGEYREDNEFLQPEEGKKYIFLNFVFINTSDSRDASVSLYSFECYADGYAADAYYGGDDSLSATLSPGRKTQGQVYFEIPVDAESVEVEYEPNFLTGEKIKFAYEGEQDSGYVMEKDTGRTEGALQVGETCQSKHLNLTFLSCYEDESDNMFITPKDGYTYVTCEVEAENTSDSDTSISGYSFDCFADGASCDAAYFRDDALSATLSAGRKAKGTVTFEVPADCQIVEVEYLDNIWTSDRIVLDASGFRNAN